MNLYSIINEHTEKLKSCLHKNSAGVTVLETKSNSRICYILVKFLIKLLSYASAVLLVLMGLVYMLQLK